MKPLRETVDTGKVSFFLLFKMTNRSPRLRFPDDGGGGETRREKRDCRTKGAKPDEGEQNLTKGVTPDEGSEA